MTPHLLAAVWAATLLNVSGGEAIPDPPVVAPLLAAGTMRAHLIDVGQADAALLEFPSGAVMIDAGAASDEDVAALLGYLDEFFQRRTDLNRTLDSIVITHNHVDHTRGLREIVEAFPVERFIGNGQRGGFAEGDLDVDFIVDGVAGRSAVGRRRSGRSGTWRNAGRSLRRWNVMMRLIIPGDGKCRSPRRRKVFRDHHTRGSLQPFRCAHRAGRVDVWRYR